MSSSLIVSATAESNIEPVPEGVHPAVCVSLYDVGTQYSEKFSTNHRKLVVSWELPDLPKIDLERDGKKESLPRCVSRRFTMSLNEKANLRHVLESWRGRKFTEGELSGFDIAKLLGVPCQLQIMHETTGTGRTFADVANVLPAARGVDVKTETPTRLFSVNDLDAPELPADLPEWIGKLVMESREWERLSERRVKPTGTASQVEPASAPAERTEDDDVPF